MAWTARECSFEAEDLVEVSVRVAGPGDVTAGTFGCPQPSDADGTVEPADDVAGADKAWWKVSPPPNFAGLLRACTADAIVEVDFDYEDGVDYEGDPRQQAEDQGHRDGQRGEPGDGGHQRRLGNDRRGEEFLGGDRVGHEGQPVYRHDRGDGAPSL